jgi:uncharacterized protein (DUF1015 family)
VAEIHPFQAIHYNPAVIKDLAKVICPPYDIIPPQMQEELYERHVNNFIRIEFGKELPQDKDTDNKYTRAAATMKKWLADGILTTDTKAALYIDDHSFTSFGKNHTRRSIFCIVKLEDWSKMIVRPHEGTLAKPKSDRLHVLWTLQTNTSPIMALYEDQENVIAPLLDKATRNKPTYTASKVNRESHKIWAVNDEAIIGQIYGSLKEKPLYIADGHHRYESALNYQKEKRSSIKSEKNDQPYDYVMMTIINMDDPGLVILPAHRMIRGLTAAALEALPERLKTFFNIEERLVSRGDAKAQITRLLKTAKDEPRLLLCGLKKGHVQVLTVRDSEAVRPMFPAFHTDLYQKLDVSIVDHVILEELLGLNYDKASFLLDYVNDPVEAYNKVQTGEYQLGIIVNPVKPGAIKAIADSGDRMPRKSTYFYPKAPAGLVSYRFG